MKTKHRVVAVMCCTIALSAPAAWAEQTGARANDPVELISNAGRNPQSVSPPSETADEASIDCFYEENSAHPDCRKAESAEGQIATQAL